jgi:hypothetical protein
MPPLARRAIEESGSTQNGFKLISIQGECTGIAHWNRLTQDDPLFQIIASL